MKGWLQRAQDERGVSAVIVAISLLALFGAAVLTIDAGSAWATRRRIVTGTDAAALAAARLFSNGLADPCTAAGQTAGEAEATTVLHANAPDARHDSSETPNGYEVTVSGCPDNPVGHVRYDGRLGSQQAFSGIFGFGQVKPISSSTAEFGYDIAPVGLRPIALCDQSTTVWPAGQPVVPPYGVPPLPPNPPGPTSVSPPGYYPHFALWNWYQKGTYANFGKAEYEKYWGSLDSDYPSVSIGNADAINNGKTYLSPAAGGGVVHRINARDDCQGGSSWRGWVALNGSQGTGSLGSCPAPKDLQTLDNMLLCGFNGFPGPVSVGDPGPPPSPPTCNNPDATDQWCAVNSGNSNGIKDALNPITCPAATLSKDCQVFPVILDNGVFTVAGKDDVHQVAFVYVILRGWGGTPGDNNPCSGGNHSCFFDFEFVKYQGTGTIGHNPSPNDISPKATDLCGVDHDSQDNRCGV